MDNEIFISSVEPQKKKKDRYNIYADGEYCCSLCSDSLAVFRIKEGAFVSEKELKKAVEADNAQYAFDSAANLLSYKMRTKSELKEKLASKKIDESAINSAIEKLEGYGYVDDSQYANEYVQSAVSSSRLGRKAVEYKLRQKGISEQDARKALENYSQDDERSAAKALYNKLNSNYKDEDQRKIRQKIYSNLLRRGFSYDVISSVMAEDEDID